MVRVRVRVWVRVRDTNSRPELNLLEKDTSLAVQLWNAVGLSGCRQG